MKFARYALVLLLASPVAALEIVINQGVENPTSIAIVPFAGYQGSTASGIVSFDLLRSGQFAPLATDNMLSYPAQPEEVIYRDWRILGVDFLVVGELRDDVAGRLTAKYHLFDVTTERLLSSRLIRTNGENLRDVSHLIADEVYERITGVPGAFSTKLMYVVAHDIGTPDAYYRLEVADTDGARRRVLFSSDQPLLSPTWSFDGSRVAYVSFEEGSSAVFVQDLQTGDRMRVAAFQGVNSAPSFSPDGTQLAMSLSRDGNPEIYLLDIATGSFRRLTTNPAIDTEPSFTADGERLVFTSDRGGRPQVYMMSLSNLVPQRITFRGNYNANAQLLPDDERMVFVHRTERRYHIAWQDLEGDRGVNILTETSLDDSPSIAPNGSMLIYATKRNGKGIISVVSIDGQVHFDLPDASGNVVSPAWSPYLKSSIQSSDL